MSDLRNTLAAMRSQGFKIREVSAYKAESAANTFTEDEINLASHFTQVELNAGVVLVGGLMTIDPATAAAINTKTIGRGQVTKTQQVAMLHQGSSELLLDKTLHGSVGGAVASVNYSQAHKWPRDEMVLSTRMYKIDKNNPKIWVNQKRKGLAAAGGLVYNLFFAFP